MGRFVEHGVADKSNCRQDNGGAEDVEMGKCMENLGVKAGDSRDEYGQKRFFPFTPENHLLPGKYPQWYLEYIFYDEVCSRVSYLPLETPWPQLWKPPRRWGNTKAQVIGRRKNF